VRVSRPNRPHLPQPGAHLGHVTSATKSISAPILIVTDRSELRCLL